MIDAVRYLIPTPYGVNYDAIGVLGRDRATLVSNERRYRFFDATFEDGLYGMDNARSGSVVNKREPDSNFDFSRMDLNLVCDARPPCIRVSYNLPLSDRSTEKILLPARRGSSP
jgi:hypothetical protein